MSRMLRLLILLLFVGADHSHAQEAGDPRAGLRFSREMCSACHAILNGDTHSPDPKAPSFERIANVPGMTRTALTVALRTSHKTMPNIMLTRRNCGM